MGTLWIHGCSDHQEMVNRLYFERELGPIDHFNYDKHGFESWKILRRASSIRKRSYKQIDFECPLK